MKVDELRMFASCTAIIMTKLCRLIMLLVSERQNMNMAAPTTMQEVSIEALEGAYAASFDATLV